MENPESRKRKKLTVLLVAVFIFALLMGPGPGVYLVNPEPGAPHADHFFLGMPVVWLWAVFWFMVQGACVVVAYFKLWKEEQ